MPLAAWLLSESLQRWAAAWPAGTAEAATAGLHHAILQAADRGGLMAQVGGALWL